MILEALSDFLVLQQQISYILTLFETCTWNIYEAVHRLSQRIRTLVFPQHCCYKIEKHCSKCTEDEETTWNIVCEHIKAAGMRANEARKEYEEEEVAAVVRTVLIAGCIPPLSASYRFDLVRSEDEMDMSYRKIVDVIKQYSDVLLCETLSSVKETRAAARAANRSGLPMWVSWSLHEDNSGTLSIAESIADAVNALRGIDRLEACLFNCCSPESITVALPLLQDSLAKMGWTDVRIGGYANGFVTVHSTTSATSTSTSTIDSTSNTSNTNIISSSSISTNYKESQAPSSSYSRSSSGSSSEEYSQDLSPEQYLRRAEHWVGRLGASVVGGCCGVFPEHIRALSDGLL